MSKSTPEFINELSKEEVAANRRAAKKLKKKELQQILYQLFKFQFDD